MIYIARGGEVRLQAMKISDGRSSHSHRRCHIEARCKREAANLLRVKEFSIPVSQGIKDGEKQSLFKNQKEASCCARMMVVAVTYETR